MKLCDQLEKKDKNFEELREELKDKIKQADKIREFLDENKQLNEVKIVWEYKYRYLSMESNVWIQNLEKKLKELSFYLQITDNLTDLVLNMPKNSTIRKELLGVLNKILKIKNWEALLDQNIFFERVKNDINGNYNIHIFSDGARKHYKQKFSISFTGFLAKIFSHIIFEWNFFLSNHGFNSCDAGSHAKRRLIWFLQCFRRERLGNATNVARCITYNEDEEEEIVERNEESCRISINWLNFRKKSE